MGWHGYKRVITIIFSLFLAKCFLFHCRTIEIVLAICFEILFEKTFIRSTIKNERKKIVQLADNRVVIHVVMINFIQSPWEKNVNQYLWNCACMAYVHLMTSIRLMVCGAEWLRVVAK